MVGLYFMFSLLLSMIFTKKIASSPLVIWFESLSHRKKSQSAPPKKIKNSAKLLEGLL
jgi:hypothetical protein